MPQRETLEVDVLIVGAGPAGLACAIRLMDAAGENKPAVLIIEKGTSVGAHILSGAVLDPRALNELIPDWKEQQAPVSQPVSGEEIWLLTERGKHVLPNFLVPPYLHNAGNQIISLEALTQWLAAQARACGVEILEGVAGAEVVLDGKKVLGLRCNDTGVGRDGQPTEAFMPGAEIRAKVTVFCEGVRGSLTKQLVRMLALDGLNPQTYALGIKEVWELPAKIFPAGNIVHTLGFPLQSHPFGGAHNAFGGSFLYGLDATHLIVGLVVGLDYRDAALDPHDCFNRFKNHPALRAMLEQGKLLSYGAKAIPEGGWHAMPQLSGDGFCLCGDSAGILNAARLKGIHLAMKSGMLAAETIAEALVKNDTSAAQLATYRERFDQSWAKDELYRARNWRQGYAGSLAAGAVHDFAQRLSGGRGLKDPLSAEPDGARLEKISPEPVGRASLPAGEKLKPDGRVTFDRISDVYHSGTNHEENQPCHLVVPDLKLCVERCSREYGNPCQYFCPAGVYEWLTPENAKPEQGRLQINAGNCVHCKTCDIKDPYENILWKVPEGGGGPRYQFM